MFTASLTMLCDIRCASLTMLCDIRCASLTSTIIAIYYSLYYLPQLEPVPELGVWWAAAEQPEPEQALERPHRDIRASQARQAQHNYRNS